MDSTEDKWKTFDIVNNAHQFYMKEVLKIQEEKEQKITGKRAAAYFVTCSKCHKKVKLAFTGIDYKNERFICFNCLIHS
jgi:hypothetical protein